MIITQTKIERFILNVLDEYKPHLTPEPTLFENVRQLSPGKVTRAQFDAALSALIVAEPPQVFRTDAAGDGAKYRITSAGEARLSE